MYNMYMIYKYTQKPTTLYLQWKRVGNLGTSIINYQKSLTILIQGILRRLFEHKFLT